MSQRNFYRLRFPPSAALKLQTNQGEYRVCELAERGMRIACDESCNLKIGQLLSGSLHLHDGSTITVRGLAQRKDHSELVVTQLEGIELEKMMQEQRFVIQNFPAVRLPVDSSTPLSTN